LLSVILISQLNDFFDARSSELSLEKLQIITPNPIKADEIRHFLSQQFSTINADVVTISHFTSELLQKIDIEGELKRKSELLLVLATIWKKYQPEASAEAFLQAFTLFTDLRSYSTEIDLFDGVFETLDPMVVQSLKVFWSYLSMQGWLDEHETYYKLASALKSISPDESPPDFAPLIFWGFGHLNGNQIDLMKSLSLWTQVWVPFDKEIYEQSHSSDYIRWFENESVEDLSLEREKPARKIPLIRFAKNRMAETLLSFKENAISEQFLLAEKKLKMEHLHEIPYGNLSFKVQSEIFQEEFSRFKSKIFELIQQTPQLPMSTANQFIADEFQAQLMTGKPNHRYLRVLQIAEEVFTNYGELSDLNEELTLYDYKILLEIIFLDLPRVYEKSLDRETGAPEAISLNGIGTIKNDRPLILCVNSGHGSIRGEMTQNYNLRTLLSPIAPIRRPELEYLMLKKTLLSVVANHPDVTFLVEEGLEKSDLAWREIMDELEFHPLTKSHYQKFIIKDFLVAREHPEVAKVSATRLQSYYDCPRKFYFETIEKLGTSAKLSNEVSPSELGNLEHALIKEWFLLQGPCLETLGKKLFDDYLKKEKKDFSLSEYNKYLKEIILYADSGIKFVQGVANTLGDGKIELEKSINGVSFSGSIDCLVLGLRGWALIDFKRSAGSIPSSLNKLLDFDKIQLWFYLNRLDLSLDDLQLIGYLNLSDPESSLFITPNKDEHENFAENCDFEKMKWHVPKLSLGDLKTSYQALEQDLISKLKADEDFNPSPRTSAVCLYCPIKNVCPRESDQVKP